MDNDLREFFGEPISVYTDAQAVKDGVLVDISALHLAFRGMTISRMTSHLYAELEPFLEPYEVLYDGDPSWKMKGLRQIFKTKLTYAYHQGDIWQLPPGLWLIENELGGWTVMFPEDY